MFADDFHVGCFWQKRAHYRFLAVLMEAEILEGVGFPALHDRVSLDRRFGHAASVAEAERIRSSPVIGTPNQPGLWAISYWISHKAFSKTKNFSMLSEAREAAGQISRLLIASR